MLVLNNVRLNFFRLDLGRGLIFFYGGLHKSLTGYVCGKDDISS